MSGQVITSRFISRFTDSPEPGSKGRAKRNRNSLTPADLEPRKNLRSSKAKGKGKKGQNNGSSGSDEFNFPAPSSPAKDSGKRKSRPDDSEENKKRVTSAEFAAKFRSKYEVYTFCAVDVGAYLP